MPNHAPKHAPDWPSRRAHISQHLLGILLNYGMYEALDRCWTILFSFLSNNDVFYGFESQTYSHILPVHANVAPHAGQIGHQIHQIWHLKPLMLVYARTWEMLYTSLTLSFLFYWSDRELWVLGWCPWIYFLPFHAHMCPQACPRLTIQKSSHESTFARDFAMLCCVWFFG